MAGDGDASRDAGLHDARFGLWEWAPQYSARRVITAAQFGVLLLAGSGAVFAWMWAPGLVFLLVRLAFWAIFTALVVLRLMAAGASLRALRAPPRETAAETPRYSILCPLYREPDQVALLAGALDRLTYPKDQLDILFIAEADDSPTCAALAALPPAPHRRTILTPPSQPRTKPKALNYGLAYATGDYVAVFDAEDIPDPHQLEAALDAFAAGGERLAAVQSPLRVDTGDASWIASQFAAEYAIQFRAVLPLLARLNLPLPLGGAGNHFRRAALEDAGGWDAFNVTEDADLAYRLARRGWRLGVIDAPTHEEGPTRLRAWLRQRTRWLKGHLQTWLVLMRSPGRTAREMGLPGFLCMQLVLGGGLLAACAHAPLLALVIVSLVAPKLSPLHAPDLALLVAGYAAAALCAIFAAAVERDRRLALSALTMPLYWPLATLAGVAALLEILVRPHYWAKTEHGLSPRQPPT